MKGATKNMLTVLLLASAACDAELTQIDDPVQEVVLSAAAAEMQTDATMQVSAVARLADGTVRQDAVMEWTVSDTAIAAISGATSQTATVTGKKAGDVTISAATGGKSASLHIRVVQPQPANPVPTLSRMVPYYATEGSAGFTLQLKGTGFRAQSVVQWNGVTKPTAFVSDSVLSVVVTPADVQTAGDAAVRVFNPAPGGGSSFVSTFLIYGEPASMQLLSEPWPEIFLPGEHAQVEAIVKDRLGRELNEAFVTWSSMTSSVAVVDQTGRVTMVGSGQARVRAQAGTIIKDAIINVAALPAGDVIYDALEDGVRQLFISTPNVAGRRKLFNGVVQATQAAPSPDGRRIAFVGVGTQGSSDIFVANIDGSGIHQLTFDGLTDDQPAWSPDGQRIAFRSQRNSGYNDVWVMNADGSGLRNMTNDEVRVNQTGYEHPTWSPDGQYLVFSTSDYGMSPRRAVLLRLRLSDGTRSIIVNDPSLSDSEPAYGNRSDLIAIRRTFNNDLGDQIQFINPLNGQTWLYIDYPGFGTNPAISPDGAWIAFESTPRNAPARGIFLNWIGTFYRRTVGVGTAAGNPANPQWIAR